MLALKIVWSYVKKYWGFLAIIIGGIVGYIFLRKKDVAFVEDLKRINDVHAQELKKIQDARAEEQRLNAENQAKLEQTLETIKKQYEQQNKALDDKKKKEIEDIVKEHGSDPDALAKKLADVTGFKVIN